MKKPILLALALFTILFANAQVNIGVTPYTTLQAAFAAINAGTHTGAITVTITGNTSETGTAVLNASGTGSANYTSVTVFPTSSGLTISGSLNAPLIDLNGADNVTFDGRVNATGSTKDLVILNSNTGASASTIRFIESAQSNLVNYCILKGASQNVTGGVLFFSTSTTGTGNSNNTITLNDITGATTANANRPINCVFSLGTATRENSGNIISNNHFFDFDKISVACSAIKLSTNTSNWTISSNSFYQTTTVAKTAAGANLTIINIANTGTTYTISANFVGGNAPNCGGSAWTTNGAFNQQFFGFLISSGSCSVQGNTISNIDWTSQNVNPFYGTQVLAGTYDIGSVSGNTYGSSTGTGSIIVRNTTANAGTFGINLQSTGNGTVSNNSIGGFTVIGSASFSHNFRGILNSAVNTLTVSNNIIGSTSTANSILASSASTSAVGQSVIGIFSTGNGTLNATGNSICNLSNNYTGTNANGQVIGIKTTNGVNNLLNNTITNLKTSSANPGTNTGAALIGILQSSAVAGQVVSSNTIHHLTNTSAAAVVSNYGIYYAGPTSGTNVINGNFIHTLTLSSTATTSNITGIKANGGATTVSNNIITLGTGVSTGYVINGIYENGIAGNNNSIYFNTVYLAGTPISGSNTAAFYSNANTNTRDIRNNIFDNARSNGGTHYAAFFNYATAGTLTLDYNDYFASGTGGVLGFFNGSNVAALPLIAGNDVNSMAINPAFANAGGTTPTDYLPSAVGLSGITIPGITVDFLLSTRAATPSMGALETACTPPAAPVSTTPPANLNICNNTSTTLSATGPGTLSWYSAASGGTYLGSGGTYVTPLLTSNTTFFVQDSTCTASATRTSITVNVSSTMSSANSQTNVSCFGGGNGTATVSISGGTPAYSYSWAPSGGTAATASSLAAGNYTCTITDANGCTLSETFTITQPATALTATKTQVNVSCFGGSNGSATVNPNGGVPPYSYNWTPFGGNAATATGLVAGVYNCNITDANGCTIVKLFLITQPAPITASPTQTDVTCNGANDGTATVTGGGGVGPYTYSWAPTGGTGTTESSLAAGNYTCTITDASGCTLAQTFTITEPAVLSDTPSQTNISCNGAGDGTATVTISGGTSPYTYAWLPSGGTGATANALGVGTYTCNVTDANSCTFSETFSITEPTAITATTSQVDNTCGGGASGSATVVASGGTPAYSYLWTPSGGTAATASSLSAGSYTCTITDANGCTLTKTFTITAPPAIGATTSQTDISCSGGSNGSASVVASGGTPGYTYAWTPSGGTAATASSLSAGSYTCTITDASACILTVTFNITEPAPLAATTSQNNNSCNGTSSGNATVSVSGGTPAYSYSWAPSGGTAATASSLAAGNYTCTVTDANACSIAVTITITEPPAITSTNSQTDITCFGGNNGSATVSVSGGTPAYTYNWMPSGGSGTTASSLTAGTYTCIITDANTCIHSESFTITEPSALTVTPSQTNISCFGAGNGTATVTVSGGTPVYSYSWAPSGGTAATASSLSAGTYTCTITDANSCIITQTFTIVEPGALTASGSQTDVSCNAGSNGSATVIASGGTPVYTYNWTPSGGTAATASSLTAGTYTCTITDANSCIATQTFTITEPSALTATSSSTGASCGGNNGTATVVASGGTPGYTYSWAPSGGTAATASSLTAGNYTCTITDANSCTTTSSVTVTSTGGLTASITSSSNVSCNGANDGTATAAPVGGTAPFTYAWAPSGGTAATASGLAPGSYTCTITDFNGCFATASVTITQPPALLVSGGSQTDVSCNGGNNGSATITATGGTGPLSYDWTPGNPTGDGTPSISGLTAGSWTCTITDANGCTAGAVFTITEPSPISTSVVTVNNVTCNGSNNGHIAISPATGGTPGYTYDWTPGNPVGDGTVNVTGLTAGTWTCTITDASGCTITQTVTITEPPALVASALSQTNVLCNGGNNGAASVSVSGGTPAYSYDWNPGTPAGDGTASVTGLTAGSWTCTVTDANLCLSSSVVFNITEPTPLIASALSQTNVSCNGGSNGSASVSVSGGTPAYSYSWAPSGGTASTASSLTAGTYTCTITDANGCTTTQIFNITEPTPLTTTTMQTNVSCFGGNNGDAMVMISGGIPAYTYNWTPSGGTGAMASSLTAGTYTCTTTDANGCTLAQTFTITEPPVLTVTSSQTNVTCFSSANGTATVVVSGGTPGYAYSWAPSGGNAATASGLAPGSYTCTITDANGCTQTATFTITQPTALTAVKTQTNVSCFGGNNGSGTVTPSGGTPPYTYSWAPSGGTGATASGLTAGTYTCTITDANGCTITKLFNITQPLAPLTATQSQTNISCFGASNGTASVFPAGGTPPYSYVWSPSGGTGSIATSLSPGSYTCTITDVNGCTNAQTFTITEPPALSLTSSQTNVSCFGGNNGLATVMVSGGTPAYTYNWAPSGGTAATASSLTAGNYTCTITDANSCSLTQTFSITQPPVLSATATQMNVTCFGTNSGQATVIASGGNPAYSYSWSPSGGTGPTASGLSAGTYTCTITDANGCTLTQTFNITEPTGITASVSQTDVLCFGGTNGTADITASGGTPGYTYLWSPGGQTSTSLTGLSAGSYTCTITDANGCTLDQGFNITEPNILAATVSQTNVICHGSSNGTATVSVTGGTLPYSFNWTPIGGTDSIATGLPAGFYTCNIIDGNGCSLSQTVSITEPSPINVTPSHTNVMCNGGNTGTATVAVTGGTAPYTYAWSPSGGTAATANNLTAGTYTCLITDAGGCTYSQSITIAQPSGLTATASQTNVSCNGGSNGTATVIVNGGAPFYTYNWVPSGGTGPVASALSAGMYTCNITDANGCTMSQSFTITEPPVLSATISSTNTNCGQSNGTATLIASGGTMPYTYAWSPAGGTGSVANGILAGTYTCTLTDAMGCSGSYTVTVIDTPAPTLSLVSQTNILCNGANTGDATVLAAGGVGPYTYMWLPSGGTAATASSLMAGTYTCTVTDSAGCTQTQSVTITEPTLLTSSSSSTTILCNGGNSTVTVIANGGVAPYTGTGTFTQTAGTYTYPITDANGCTTSTSITVTEPSLLVASSGATPILCNGGTGTVTVSASGGTGPYTGTGAFPEPVGTYTFTVTDANGCSATTSDTLTEPTLLTAGSSATSILCNGGTSTVTVTGNGGTSPYSGTGTFTQVAGTYTYPVTDANGCTTSTSITITQPSVLTSVVDSVFNPTSCSGTDGSIYITVSGGTSGYTYLWSNTATIEDITGLAAGSYSCTVTDANGCTSSVTSTLADPTPPVVTVTIDTTLCSLDAPYLLTEGNPAGGIWSGPSITGGTTFDPVAAGVGSYVLTYTYTAPTGCSASASDTIIVDACSGINENTDATNWSAYPNPSFGDVTISTPVNQTGKILVEVYSAEGKLISSEIYNGTNLIRLNLADRAVGMYLVRITTEKETSAVHVFKQ